MQHLHSFCFLTKTNLTNYTNTNVIKTFNFHIHILYVNNVRKIRNGSHFVQRNIIIILTGEGAHEFFQEFINFLGKKDWGVLGGIFAGGLIIVGALLWKFGGPGQPESPNQPEDKKTSSSGVAKAVAVPPSQSFLGRIWLNFKSAFNFEKKYNFDRNILQEHKVKQHDLYFKQHDLLSKLSFVKNQKIAFMREKITLSQQLLTFEDITTMDDFRKKSQQIEKLENEIDVLNKKEQLIRETLSLIEKDFKNDIKIVKIYPYAENFTNLKINFILNEVDFKKLTLEKKIILEDLEPKINNINAFVDLYEKVEKNLPKNIKYVNKSMFYSNTLYEEKAKTEMLWQTVSTETNYIGITEHAKTYKISFVEKENLVGVTLDFNERPKKIETYNKILYSYLRNYDQDHFAKLEKFLLKKESLPINLKNKVDDTYNGILQEFACDCEVFSVTTGICYYKQNTSVLFPIVLT